MLGFGKRAEQGRPVHCGYCRTLLAVRLEHGLTPSPRELTAVGAVPMRRAGWFCSRRCVSAYEVRFHVILEPEAWSAVESRGV